MSYPHWSGQPCGEEGWFTALANLTRYLRSPSGCPWDRKQQARDFAHHLIEEVEELNEGFRLEDARNIEEEWGDCFFVLMAVAAAAEEEGRFDVGGALEKAHEKMVRRHDHVFGGQQAATPEDALNVWERMKAQEKGSS